MDAYAGEVTGMHPFYAFDSPARALDMDLATTNAYAGPNHITAGIQHGSWSMPVQSGKAPEPSMLNSNQQAVREDLPYSKEDIEHVIEWTKVSYYYLFVNEASTDIPHSATSRPPGILWARAPWLPERATVSSSTVCSTSASTCTASRA
jgi:hypothetical protein